MVTFVLSSDGEVFSASLLEGTVHVLDDNKQSRNETIPSQTKPFYPVILPSLPLEVNMV